MASSFPGSIDNFTDPLSNSALSSPSHSGQHSDLNDAVEKIETYMGLVKVIPTAVSAGNTLAANGTITIGTTQTSITITNAFSALYDVYVINISGGAGSTSTSIALQMGATTSNYISSYLYTNLASTPVAVGSSTDTGFTYAGSMTTNGLAMSATIVSPFLAKATYCNGSTINTSFGGQYSGLLNNTTSYTDLVIKPSAGTITGGSIRVYGYRN